MIKKVATVVSMVFLLAGQSFAQNEAMKLDQKGGGTKSSRTLSVGFAVNLAADMGSLGSSIMDDGVLDLSEDSLAHNTNNTMLVMSDKDSAVGLYSAEGTNFPVFKFLNGFKEGGPMMGLNLSATCMYDFTNTFSFKLPMFARIGFDFTFRVSGGHLARTIGPGVDRFVEAQALDGVYFPHYNDAEDFYSGGKSDVVFDSKWMEIPITIGFIAPIGDVAKIYGGLGIGYIRGGWSIRLQCDNRFTQYLTAYAVESDTPPVDEPQALVSGSVDELIEFQISTVSLNFLIGAEYFFTDRIAGSFEFMGSGNAQTVYSKHEFSSKGARIATAALAGPDVYGKDPYYIKRFAYPVSIGSTAFRIGARYYIF